MNEHAHRAGPDDLAAMIRMAREILATGKIPDFHVANSDATIIRALAQTVVHLADGGS